MICQIFTNFIYIAGSSRSAESSSSSAASLSATPSSQENGGSSSQSDHSQQQQQLHQQQQQRLLVSKLSVVNTNTNTSSTNNPNESLESPSAVQAAMATVNSRKNVRNWYYYIIINGAVQVHKWCHPLRGRGICQNVTLLHKPI